MSPPEATRPVAAPASEMEELNVGDLDFDDQRVVELSALAAIFPEMVVDGHDRFTVSLDVLVNPTEVVTVAFPAVGAYGTTAAAPTGRTGYPPNGNNNSDAALDTHELAYLPSIQLRMSLPEGYPEDRPPSVVVSTSPPWLPEDVLVRLTEDFPRLWEDMGHDLVVFTYVDHVQQAAEKAFGLVDGNGFLAVNTLHKVSILDYDVKARQAAFDKETFECGVCLDPKKGVTCHRMQDCGHVFCVQCLQDYYSNAILEGDLASIRCLEPKCAKQREAALQTGKKHRKPRLVSISPGELLQIPIDEQLVKRYIDLKYKTELESDKNTIYCPRAWCNGAARSKKHKKPEGFLLHDSSDEEADADTEDEEEAGGQTQTRDRAQNIGGGAGNGAGQDSTKLKRKGSATSDERLCICEDCGFAFCSRCFLSWHGDFVVCAPRRTNGELTDEEKASLEYLALHTTPCPTCAAPAQKTKGCNHMICFRCNTHFCYLCSAWLDPSNPYRHFGAAPNGRTTGCFNRLWELQFGDEGEEPFLGFDGRPAAGVDVDFDTSDEEDSESDDDNGGGNDHRNNRDRRRNDVNRPEPAPQDGPRQVDVAREGPLVLRIAMDRAPAPAPVAPGPAPALLPPNNNNDHRHHVVVNHHNGFAQRGRAAARVGRFGAGRGRGRGGGFLEADAGPAGGRRVGRGAGDGRGRGAAVVGRGLVGRPVGRGGRGPVGAVARRGHRDVAGLAAGQVGAEFLNADMEAWVRNFVELALEDNEDQLDFDDDDAFNLDSD